MIKPTFSLFLTGLLWFLGQHEEVVLGFTGYQPTIRTRRSSPVLPALPSNSDDDDDSVPRRRIVFSWIGKTAAAVGTAFVASTTNASAAPPIAVIAEELGYFPVQNKAGEMVYVPKRVQRQSSEQAVELAKKLSQAGAVMYGAFWCPHCARQKELFGREAWQYIDYVECSPKGFGAQPLLCNKQDIDGYPTWVFRPADKKSNILGGERPLEELAQQVKLASFRPDLEQNVPPPLGSSACKQK